MGILCCMVQTEERARATVNRYNKSKHSQASQLDSRSAFAASYGTEV